jgi:putative oxidoreductase
MKIIRNILAYLLALQFIAIGIMKVVMPLFGVTTFVENMAKLNYNYYWTLLIGLIDLIGGIGLAIPKYRSYAAIGLLFLLHGALGSHITHNDPAKDILGGSFLSLILLIVLLFLEKPFHIIDKKTNKQII